MITHNHIFNLLLAVAVAVMGVSVSVEAGKQEARFLSKWSIRDLPSKSEQIKLRGYLFTTNLFLWLAPTEALMRDQDTTKSVAFLKLYGPDAYECLYGEVEVIGTISTSEDRKMAAIDEVTKLLGKGKGEIFDQACFDPDHILERTSHGQSKGEYKLTGTWHYKSLLGKWTNLQISISDPNTVPTGEVGPDGRWNILGNKLVYGRPNFDPLELTAYVCPTDSDYVCFGPAYEVLGYTFAFPKKAIALDSQWRLRGIEYAVDGTISIGTHTDLSKIYKVIGRGPNAVCPTEVAFYGTSAGLLALGSLEFDEKDESCARPTMQEFFVLDGQVTGFGAVQ